jgi:hypothetical protein
MGFVVDLLGIKILEASATWIARRQGREPSLPV